MGPSDIQNDPRQQGYVPGQTVDPSPYGPAASQQVYRPQTAIKGIYGQQVRQIYTAPSRPVRTETQYDTMPQQRARGSGGRRLLLVGMVLVVLLVGGMILLNKSGQSNAKSEDAALSALRQKGSSISASSLARINKTNLFFAVFRNAAEQPQVTTTKNFYETPKLNGRPILSDESNLGRIEQDGYNYQSRKLSFISYYLPLVDECINGVNYSYNLLYPSGWSNNPSGNNSCSPTKTKNVISDGVNTGGLNASQAQAFVDAISRTKGLVNVTSVTLTSLNRKSYIRFEVTVNKDVACTKSKKGMGCFVRAFRSLQLPNDWPYNHSYNPVSGATFAYYIDPSTQLPAYMQIAFTPVSSSGNNWSNQQIEYSFGALPTYTLSTNNIPSPTIDWPVISL